MNSCSSRGSVPSASSPPNGPHPASAAAVSSAAADLATTAGLHGSLHLEGPEAGVLLECRGTERLVDSDRTVRGECTVDAGDGHLLGLGSDLRLSGIERQQGAPVPGDDRRDLATGEVNVRLVDVEVRPAL